MVGIQKWKNPPSCFELVDNSSFFLRFFLLSYLAVWILGYPLALADSPPVEFDRGNRSLEQGQYAEAVKTYEQLIQRGQISSAVLFNLGNAYLKKGETGLAIVNYRLAQRLAPRDPDIVANLRFARESIGSTAGESSGWARGLFRFTLNELTIFVVVVFWLWMALMIAMEVRPELKKELRSLRLILGCAVMGSLLCLGVLAEKRLSTAPAVVIVGEAPVRYGPFDEAQTFFTVKDGAELSVLSQKEEWLQVQDPSRRVGWLTGKAVRILPKG